MVIVYRTFDPGLADMLSGMLEQDGIPARVIGARGSNILGAGQLLLETCVEVQEDHADRARLLVAELLASRGAFTDEETPVPPRIIEQNARAPERVSLLRALGIAPLIPGGAHLVARRPITGLLLLAAQMTMFIFMVVQHRNEDASIAGVFLAGGLLYDLVAGGLAVRAYNRGRRSGAVGQTLLAAGGLAAVMSAAVTLGPPLSRWRKDHQPGEAAEGPELRNAPQGPNAVLPPLLQTDILDPAR